MRSTQVTTGTGAVMGPAGIQESLPPSPIESVTSTDDDVTSGSGEAPKKLKIQRNRTAYTQEQIEALERGEYF